MTRSLHLCGLILLTLPLACSDRQAGSDANIVRQVAAPANSAPAVQLTGRVTDAANILNPMQEQMLSMKLEQLERSTGRQFVVATVPSLGGKEVAAFTRDLANSWGIGRKSHNDGVVLLVAPTERKARIAVGYGLEAVLSDVTCQQIMTEKMIPMFRRGDLPGGIAAGVDALIAQLQ